MGLLITTYANLVNVWKTSGKAGKQRVKKTSVYGRVISQFFCEGFGIRAPFFLVFLTVLAAAILEVGGLTLQLRSIS